MTSHLRLNAADLHRARTYITQPELCTKPGLIDWIDGLLDEINTLRKTMTYNAIDGPVDGHLVEYDLAETRGVTTGWVHTVHPDGTVDISTELDGSVTATVASSELRRI